MYVDCAVEDQASITTEPTEPEEAQGHGQTTGRRLGVITSQGRVVGQEVRHGPDHGMGSGHGQELGSGLGQVGPSGLPVGLPDDVEESDGMLCYGIFPAESRCIPN